MSVQNAVGTQKQFSAQPKSVYEQRLVGLPAQTKIDAGYSDELQKLGESLGVLGGAADRYVEHREKRKEKIGIAEAERVVSMQDEESLQKMGAIEALNNFSDFNLSDNPYAITTYEKMRGKYFASKAQTDYSTYREGLPPAKDAKEENSRFVDFMQTKYGDVYGVTSDTQAFQQGFFDNFIPAQVKVNQTWNSEKTQEIETMRKGMTLATISDIAEKGYFLNSNQIANDLTTTFGHSNMAGATIPERIGYGEEFFKSFIQMTGDYNKLTQIAENTILGVDPEGNPIKISEVINLSPYQRAGEVVSSQIYDEKKQTFMKGLEGKPDAEVNASFEGLKTSDPHFYNEIKTQRDTVIQRNKAIEDRKRLKEEQARAESFAMGQLSEGFQADWEAYNSGSDMTKYGKARATTHSDIMVKYKTINAKGEVIEKEEKATKEQAFAFAKQMYGHIVSSDKSDDEKSRDLFKLFEWKPVGFMKDTFKTDIQSALDSLSPDNPKMNDTLFRAMGMHRRDPDKFNRLFGTETSNQINVIKALSEGAGGDFTEGARRYSVGRDRLNDPTLKKAIDTKIDTRLAYGTTIAGFRTLEGGETSLNTSILSNKDIYNSVRETARYLHASGMDDQQAVKIATQEAQKYQFVYRETAVPKDIFNGIKTDQQAKVGKMALDRMIGNFSKTAGIEEQFVNIDWDSDRGLFVMSGGGQHTTRDINDIEWEGNTLLEEWTKDSKAQGHNVSLEDIVKQRTAGDWTNGSQSQGIRNTWKEVEDQKNNPYRSR